MLALIDSPYAKTPDAVYSVYYHVHEAVPGARYGGAYTLKAGFHSSVEDNLERWPGNYSIRDAINRREPRKVGRALDLTLGDTEMKRRTGYLRDAAADSDPRLACVREFYGTLNGSTVFGRAHTGPDIGWYSSSADSSHLWHIHLSFFTPYVDDWDALAGVVSVLKGETLSDYLGSIMERDIAVHGDTGAWVDFTQRHLQSAGASLTRDGRWGDETTGAMKWWFVNVAGGTAGDFDGRSVTGWILREFLRREAGAIAKAVVAEALAGLGPTGPTQAQVDAAVAAYLKVNPVKLPSSVEFTGGTLTGVKAK